MASLGWEWDIECNANEKKQGYFTSNIFKGQM